MTDDTLHTIDFVERDDYLSDDYPDPVLSLTAQTRLPLPAEGDHLTLGWYEDETGERVGTVNFRQPSSDEPPDYITSDEYRVAARDHHYHHARHDTDDGGVITDRIEVGVTIVLAAVDDDETDVGHTIGEDIQHEF